MNSSTATARMAKIARNRNIFVAYISSATVYEESIHTLIDENHPRKLVSPCRFSELVDEMVLAL